MWRTVLERFGSYSKGTSFLFGLLFGDVAGSGTLILIGRLAIDGSYSRDAEWAADRFAAKTMLALGRPPRALAQLLRRIDTEPSRIPALLSSHPLTEARLAALPDQTGPPGGPLLSPAQWLAPRSICDAP